MILNDRTPWHAPMCSPQNGERAREEPDPERLSMGKTYDKRGRLK